MSSDLSARGIPPRLKYDFSDVDPRETSRAWQRFLAGRRGPSAPLTGVRSVIYQSWLRSDSTGIRPEQCAAPTLERAASASKATYDNAELRRATRESMARIANLLTGAEVMLILTDRNGVVLDTMGDKSTLAKGAQINLGVGGLWSESASGTNGIGTALWAGEPVYVHGEEHFCEGMKAWSCAAAPIRDPVDQTIIGAIDLSGLTGIFQKHNAAFAATAARDVEIALEREQLALNFQLMEAIIGKFPERLQGEGDGLAIVDRFGRMIYNRNYGPEDRRPSGERSLGSRFLDLSDGISEEKILALLPEPQQCQEIQMIEIDGTVRGAALVFKNASAYRAPARPPASVAAPAVTLGTRAVTVIGQSGAIRAALALADDIAAANIPTLIEGATGVGKELFARLIYSRINPSGKPSFTALRCGALTREMCSDGTLGRHLDKATMAISGGGAGGLLCLDEVGELSGDVQSHLQDCLEERMSLPSGEGGNARPLQLVSMTSRSLIDEVAAGRFRRDLFYRLNAIVLKIPPLKNRGDDVLLIADYYNRMIGSEPGRKMLQLGPDFQQAFMAHSWPGNVRELRNVIYSLHVLAKSRPVSGADLPAEFHSPVSQPDVRATLLVPIAGEQPGMPASLRHAEAQVIAAALSALRGNMSKAALALGISRPTLYRKMQGYGIAPGRQRKSASGE